jgi:hypothetical protein
MSMKLTPRQYSTLEFIATCPNGRTLLLPMYWRDRHHQALIKRGFLRLRADPFMTKANMLRGLITAKGRKAVEQTPPLVRAVAKANEDRDYERYVREQEEA